MQVVENIAVAVAALRLEEDLRVVLQAGRGEVANQTRALFEIGHVRDVYRIGGTVLAAVALGSEAKAGFLHDDVVYLVGPQGDIEPYEPDFEAGPSSIPGDDGASTERRAKPMEASRVAVAPGRPSLAPQPQIPRRVEAVRSSPRRAPASAIAGSGSIHTVSPTLTSPRSALRRKRPPPTKRHLKGAAHVDRFLGHRCDWAVRQPLAASTSKVLAAMLERPRLLASGGECTVARRAARPRPGCGGGARHRQGDEL